MQTYIRLPQLGAPAIEIKIIFLIILLLVAVWFDLRSRKIPNLLVFTGLLISLGIQLIVSPVDLNNWFSGMLVGFALFMPLYLLGAMGAGDVKLMATVGSFLGIYPTLGAIFLIFISGGILGLGVTICRGTLKIALENVRFIIIESIFNKAPHRDVAFTKSNISAGNLPYAVAIAVGTLIQLLLMRTGHTLLG